jgi:hypothetical protein
MAHSVAQAVQFQVVGWLVNNEFERMCLKMIMAKYQEHTAFTQRSKIKPPESTRGIVSLWAKICTQDLLYPKQEPYPLDCV